MALAFADVWVPQRFVEPMQMVAAVVWCGVAWCGVAMCRVELVMVLNRLLLLLLLLVVVAVVGDTMVAWCVARGAECIAQGAPVDPIHFPKALLR